MRHKGILKTFLLFKLMKKLPLFPLIPVVPVALIVSSLVTSLRALVRVRHLEQRLGDSPT